MVMMSCGVPPVRHPARAPACARYVRVEMISNSVSEPDQHRLPGRNEAPEACSLPYVPYVASLPLSH